MVGRGIASLKNRFRSFLRSYAHESRKHELHPLPARILHHGLPRRRSCRYLLRHAQSVFSIVSQGSRRAQQSGRCPPQSHALHIQTRMATRDEPGEKGALALAAKNNCYLLVAARRPFRAVNLSCRSPRLDRNRYDKALAVEQCERVQKEKIVISTCGSFDQPDGELSRRMAAEIELISIAYMGRTVIRSDVKPATCSSCGTIAVVLPILANWRK